VESQNSIIMKGLTLVLGGLLTTVSWFIKMEITDVADTLKGIKGDVSDLNKDSILLKQRVDFQIDWMQREIKETKERVVKLEGRFEKRY
jgi:hypothetical protein